MAEDEAFRERFIRDCRAAAALDHPNVVTVYDAGEADGVLYLSMRYVEGTDLERLLEVEGYLSPEVALSIVVQCAAALDAAHAEGLVHRGVVPAAILLERGWMDDGRAFLTDFGIAKHVAASTRMTRTGSFAGTVDYVAPRPAPTPLSPVPRLLMRVCSFGLAVQEDGFGPVNVRLEYSDRESMR